MAEGIEVRHSRSCASRAGRRCTCEPGYRVAVYDAIARRKVSKTFRTLAEARRWRATAQTQAAKGVRCPAPRRRSWRPQRRSSRESRAARSGREPASGTSPRSSASTSGRCDSTSSPRSAARSSRRSSGATSSASRTRCSRRRRPEHDPERAQAAPGDLPARDRGRRPRRQSVRAAPAAGCPRPPRAHRLADRSRRVDRRASPGGPRALGLRVLRGPAPRRAASARLGRRRPRRRSDSRRAEHERPRRDRRPEEPRRPIVAFRSSPRCATSSSSTSSSRAATPVSSSARAQRSRSRRRPCVSAP